MSATDRLSARSALRVLALGATLGLVLLGVGGRIAMRLVALRFRPEASFALGGTITVVASGVGAGVLGALMWLVSSKLASFVPGARVLVRLALFAAMLAWVTVRGLHGSPPEQWIYLWPLMAAYGAAMAVIAPRITDEPAAPDESWRPDTPPPESSS